MFLAHSRNYRNNQLLAIIKVFLDLVADIALWDFHIVLLGTFAGHEIKKTVIDVDLSGFSLIRFYELFAHSQAGIRS